MANLNAAFGPGSGRIILDDVACSGSEQRLFDCPYRGLEIRDCTHNQDAGVTCITGISLSNLQFYPLYHNLIFVYMSRCEN